MSAKLICSLSDNENPDLQKQIGCMNGIFQLFDRHRRIAGHGRVNNAQPPKRLLPPGQENGNQAVQNINQAKKKDSKKGVKEKRRSSTESSRHSFSSSSCSSSFSSLDYSKTANPEPCPSSQNSSSGTPSRDLSEQPNGPMLCSRRSLDLRDVVKGSMNREASGLSVKTAAKEGTVVHSLRYIDSPRPRSSGASDSFRVLSKFREENDGRTLRGPKDLRRLSYDGRESRDNLKSTIKIKELPRLSLDSRQGCVRGSTQEVKAYLLHDLRIERRNPNETMNLLQEPGSSRRASSVVAKLMGLVDPMPVSDDCPEKQDKNLETEKTDPMSRSSRMSKVNKQEHFPGSPRISQDLNSPRLRNADLVLKMNANQKFPIETASWRQQLSHRGPQPPAFKCREAPMKISTTPLTVYGEIEKRLADLEFKKSGKDLRALKQILEAMQKTKSTLDDQKGTKLASQEIKDNGIDCSASLGSQRNLQSNGLIQGSSTLVGYKSPIVIMKPAKLMGRNTDSSTVISSTDNLLEQRKHGSADNRKASVEKRTTKHMTERNAQLTNSFKRNQFSKDKSSSTRMAKLAQTSKDTEENTESLSRISGTMSPRLQPRRLRLDKLSSPANPSESNSSRRHNSRQTTQSSSPGKKCRPNSSNSETDGRDFCRQGNASPLQSDSNISLASEEIDNEVTSVILPDQNPSARNSVNRKMTEPGRATPEQPSPVSVLDAAFYRDDSPSPVKKTSNAFKYDEIPYPDEVEWTLRDLDLQSNGRTSSLSTELDLKTQDNIKQRAQNPEATNLVNMELLCDSPNLDHIYISHILSASDLPRELESGKTNIPLHQSGHLINPELFYVLEQHGSKARASYDEHRGEKTHRKLVFDVVNEILVRKLVVTDSFTEWLSSDKLTREEPKGKQILRQLCSEVDQLQCKNSGNTEEDDEEILRSIICDDMMNWPMNCTAYGKEIPAVVLDVERLIFKDLVTEFVTGEADGLKSHLGGHCRQLFYK